MAVDFVLFSAQKSTRVFPGGYGDSKMMTLASSFPHDHVASIQTASPKRVYPLENLKIFTVYNMDAHVCCN